ncbi:MAG: beta strand repeat-containing protein, partial [Flavobacteriales bacterium]
MQTTILSRSKQLLLSIFFASVSFLAFSQNLITVPFSNGFVGDNGGSNNATNCYYHSGTGGLGWTNVQFAQNSTSTIFTAQGNDIIGMVLITDNSGVEHTINGFIKWRSPSGNNPYVMVFQPSTGTSATLATNSFNGSSTYTITDTKYIGLVFNGNTLTISPVPGTVTGNAATNGLLDALNAYLATFGKLSVADVTVNEGAGTATITVTLSASSTNTITVVYTTSNGTATAGADYTAATGTLTFAPGQTSRTFTISITDDATVESIETINVTLTDPTNASILDGAGVVSITDNDSNTPTSNAGADASICAGNTFATSGVSSNGTIAWSTSGTGNFTNGTTATATYTPSAADISAGTVTLTMTVTGTGSATDAMVLTITPQPSAGTLSGNQSICVGSTTTFSSNVNGGAWTSSDLTVATVNSSTGVVTGVAAGTATITYTVTGTGGCANATATRTVTVTAAPSAGTISGTTAICANGSSTLTSSVTGGSWSSATPAVATINASTGAVAGVSAGTSVMTYTVTGTGGCANATTTATVTVTAVPSAGTLSGTQGICVGATSTFTSTVSGGAWTSSDLTVATVNSSTGVVTGVAAGTATITYTVNGTGGCSNATATRAVTINALPNAPTVSSPQLACPGNTVADLIATAGSGESIQWFSAASGGSALASTTALVAGTTYYAQATNSNACVSASRTPLAVVFNNSLHFDATNDYVNIGDVIENLSDFTTEAWVYWQGSSLAYSEIFTKDVISSMAITSADKLHSNFGNGTGWVAGLDSQTPIPLNKWTHVAVTRQNGVVKMYINGIEDAATITNNATGQNAAPRIIGGKMVGSSVANTLFNGRIDEVRCWSVARTAAQISANLSTQFVGNEANLLAYFNFNQGAPSGNNTGITILTNAVSAGSNGTITSFTMTGATSNFVAGYFPEITGNNTVLAGSTIQLSNAVSGGTWSSSNTATATVNSSGLVSGVAAGSVTITYTYCGQSTTYAVTVNSSAVITVNSSSITNFASCQGSVSTAQTISVSGTSLTANVTVTAPTGYEVSLSAASGYASSLTITASGTLSATTVYVRLTSTASVGSVNGSLSIASTGATTQTVSLTGTVTAPPSAGTISGTQSACVGSTTTFSSTVTGGAWTSSNTTIATVDPSTGVVTGVAAGTATITYTITGTGGCADATATRTVTVTAAPATPAGSVTVQPTCGTPTGTIVFTTQSGVEYSINGTTYQASATFTGVAPGSYTLRVRSTANNACITSGSSVTVNAVPSAPATPAGSVTVQPTCGTPTGTIVFTTQSGVEYSINGTTYQASATFTGVAPGSYTLRVRSTTDNTCITSGSSVTVNAVPTPPATPTATATQPTCAVTTGTIAFTTQTGVQYSVGGAYQASNSFTGLAAGTYPISVRSTADNTCITTGTSIT